MPRTSQVVHSKLYPDCPLRKTERRRRDLRDRGANLSDACCVKAPLSSDQAASTTISPVRSGVQVSSGHPGRQDQLLAPSPHFMEYPSVEVSSASGFVLLSPALFAWLFPGEEGTRLLSAQMRVWQELRLFVLRFPDFHDAVQDEGYPIGTKKLGRGRLSAGETSSYAKD